MAKPMMTPDRLEKLRYYAGGNVTVGTISQVEGKATRRYYVGKVRGRIVSSKMTDGKKTVDVFKFETPDEARSHAWAWRESHRKELAAYEKRHKTAVTLLAQFPAQESQ